MLADRETTVSDLPVLPQSKRPRLDADSKELGSQAYKVQSVRKWITMYTRDTNSAPKKRVAFYFWWLCCLSPLLLQPQSTVSSNTLLTPSVSYVSTTLASGCKLMVWVETGFESQLPLTPSCTVLVVLPSPLAPEVNPMPASLPPSDALDILAADDSSDNNDEELLSNLAFEQLPESSLLPPSSTVQSTSPGASQNMSPGLSLPSTTSSVMPSIEPSLVPYQEPGSKYSVAPAIKLVISLT